MFAILALSAKDYNELVRLEPLTGEAAAAVNSLRVDKHGSDHGQTFDTDATDYVNLQRPSYYRQNHKDPWKNNGWARFSAKGHSRQ